METITAYCVETGAGQTIMFGLGPLKREVR